MTKQTIDLSRLGAFRPMNRAPSLGPGLVRVAVNEQGEADLYIYGIIGDWFDGIQAADVVRDIATIEAETINVRINSPGGVVFDGVAIYNALAQHRGKVIVHVDAVAASIASVIAMAGDEIRIGEAANIMIHKPMSFAIGEADDLRKEAEVLDTLEAGIVDIYAARTGQTTDQLAAWMKDETWFRGQAAIEAGFADVVVAAKQREKRAARSMLFALYRNTPDDLLAEQEGPQARNLEHLLRDGEGRSKREAKRIAALASRIFAGERDAPPADLCDEGGEAALHDALAAFKRGSDLFTV